MDFQTKGMFLGVKKTCRLKAAPLGIDHHCKSADSKVMHAKKSMQIFAPVQPDDGGVVGTTRPRQQGAPLQSKVKVW